MIVSNKSTSTWSDQASFSDRSLGARSRIAGGSLPFHLSKGSRQDLAHQGVSPFVPQDTGILGAGGRSLPHPSYAYARGFADRTHDRARTWIERGSHRGYRARARSGPYAVRARGRGIDQPLLGSFIRGSIRRHQRTRCCIAITSRACAWSRSSRTKARALT